MPIDPESLYSPDEINSAADAAGQFLNRLEEQNEAREQAVQEETAKGIQLNHIMRHTVGLFHGQNGSKTWKQYHSKNMCIRDADLQKVNHIMDQVRKTNPVSLER